MQPLDYRFIRLKMYSRLLIQRILLLQEADNRLLAAVDTNGTDRNPIQGGEVDLGDGGKRAGEQCIDETTKQFLLNDYLVDYSD